MITDPNCIRAVQIRAQISAVKLEKLGMKRRGRSLTVMLKEFYGLPKRSSYDDVLASLNDDLKAMDEIILQEATSGANV